MAVSELPGNPNAVWTVKTHSQGNYVFMKKRAGQILPMTGSCKHTCSSVATTVICYIAASLSF